MSELSVRKQQKHSTLKLAEQKAFVSKTKAILQTRSWLDCVFRCQNLGVSQGGACRVCVWGSRAAVGLILTSRTHSTTCSLEGMRCTWDPARIDWGRAPPTQAGRQPPSHSGGGGRPKHCSSHRRLITARRLAIWPRRSPKQTRLCVYMYVREKTTERELRSTRISFSSTVIKCQQGEMLQKKAQLLSGSFLSFQGTFDVEI